MDRLKGKGTVDCHDTETRKMALQINEKSFWLLSAGRDVQVAITAGLWSDPTLILLVPGRPQLQLHQS